MAVVSVNEIHERRSASADEQGNYRRRAFRVVCNAVSDGPSIAIQASGLPTVGDNFPGSTTIKCRSIGEPESPDRLVYIFTFDYSDVSNSTSGTATVDPNPLNRPADIEWGGTPYRVSVERDVETDEPFVNSAGDPYDTQLEEEQERPLCIIERNVSSHSVATANSLRNTVNSASITVAGETIGEREGLMKRISARAAYEGGVSYIRERIEIELAPSHVRQVLDRGYRIRNVVSGPVFQMEATQITDSNGLPITTPALLNGSGGVLAASGTPVYRAFNTKVATSWASLSLPTTFPDA